VGWRGLLFGVARLVFGKGGGVRAGDREDAARIKTWVRYLTLGFWVGGSDAPRGLADGSPTPGGAPSPAP
jgi:hypothetical protein